MIVVAVAVGLGVGLVALRARSDDVDAVVAAADREDGASSSDEAERLALAGRAGLRVEDLLVRASGPEGVTREEFEASERLRAELLDPAVTRAAAAALRQRLEWAAEYADGQRLAAARRVLAAGMTGVDESSSVSAAVESPGALTARESADCRPFCEFLRRCNGSEEPGDWTGCLAACGRGEFGMEAHLQSVVALGDCEHL
jgi:hypothetical protein